MAARIAEAPFLTNIGFLITYKCQVACAHCVVHAGPHRTEEMCVADACFWIEQAGAYRDGRIKAACFTGGEPFHNLAKLEQLCVFAVAHGMVPTAATNAFWAESRQRALEVLADLRELRILSVSADAHHQSQIPFERVKNALLAAQELGLIYRVTVCTEDEDDPAHRELLERLGQITDADHISTVITAPAGRALVNIKSLHYAMADEPPATACPTAHTPTIFPDGRVYACVGPVIDLPNLHPLLLGNAREKPLAQILDEAETNAALHILRVWGPIRLLNLLRERGFGLRLPRTFVKNSMCNLCYCLMRDPELCSAIRLLGQDAELFEKTAYARVYYLDEETMVGRRSEPAPNAAT